MSSLLEQSFEEAPRKLFARKRTRGNREITRRVISVDTSGIFGTEKTNKPLIESSSDSSDSEFESIKKSKSFSEEEEEEEEIDQQPYDEDPIESGEETNDIEPVVSVTEVSNAVTPLPKTKPTKKRKTEYTQHMVTAMEAFIDLLQIAQKEYRKTELCEESNNLIAAFQVYIDEVTMELQASNTLWREFNRSNITLRTETTRLRALREKLVVAKRQNFESTRKNKELEDKIQATQTTLDLKQQMETYLKNLTKI